MTLLSALDRRVRTDGSRPLLTYYHLERGERVEFNAKSFANWVDKTANLLDEVDVTDPIDLAILDTNPAHWMTLIWPLAIWRAGLEIADGPSQTRVVGPSQAFAQTGVTVIACSLHPLGVGLPQRVGVVDFAREVLGQPDGYVGCAVPSPSAGPAFASVSGRILVTAGDFFAQAIAGPLLGGGSAVVVDGPATASELARISESEKVTEHRPTEAIKYP